MRNRWPRPIQPRLLIKVPWRYEGRSRHLLSIKAKSDIAWTVLPSRNGT